MLALFLWRCVVPPAQKFIRCLYPDGWFMLYLRYEMTH